MSGKILIELTYLPLVPYTALLGRSEEFCLEQCEHYQKGSYRNRTRIATANGVQELSIPLRRGKNEQQPIREVEIAYEEPWQKKHWRSIETAYRSAPYFDHYAPFFAPFYQQKITTLFDWNLKLLQTFLDCLGWDLELCLTDSFVPIGKPASEYRDLRNHWRAKSGAKRPVAFPDTRPYPQVFQEKHGFLPNLSTLDLLFCVGPEAVNYL